MPVKSIKNVLSAIVALAVLALPAIALAGHEHDWNEGSRPFVWHDQGWHRGWFKHHRQVRPAEDEDDQGDYGPFGSPERPPAFLCDEDGDDCEPNSVDWGYGRYVPPISYDRDVPSAGYDLVQQHNWLLDHQRRAYDPVRGKRLRYGTVPIRQHVSRDHNGGSGGGNARAERTRAGSARGRSAVGAPPESR